MCIRDRVLDGRTQNPFLYNTLQSLHLPGGGKIPINYDYVTGQNDRKIIMENYKGDVYKYPLTKIGEG